MVTRDFADSFADEWIAAWNAHDLPRVLSHYEDDFEMASPLIIEVAGEPSGVLRGKKNVSAYWEKALGQVPDLRFEKLGMRSGDTNLTQINSRRQSLAVAQLCAPILRHGDLPALDLDQRVHVGCDAQFFVLVTGSPSAFSLRAGGAVTGVTRRSFFPMAPGGFAARARADDCRVSRKGRARGSPRPPH